MKIVKYYIIYNYIPPNVPLQLAAQKMADPTKTISGTRSEFPVPMNKMRKRISERLKEAQNTTAMLTTYNECDMRYLKSYTNLKYEGSQILRLIKVL